MAQNYGRLGGRRSGGTWQWMLVGFLPGVLCGGVILFGLSFGGFLNLGSLVEQTPVVQTQVVAIVQTPTPDPDQPTITPWVVTATQEPITPTATVAVVAATPTVPLASPAVDLQSNLPNPGTVDANAQAAAGGTGQTPNSPVAGSSGLGDEEAGSGVGTTTGDTGLSLDTGVDGTAPINPNASALPEALIGVPGTTVVVQGGTFEMGTTPDEVLIAVNQCVERDAGNCQLSYGEDSTPAFQVQLPPYRIETTEVTFEQYAAFLNYLRSQGQTHLNGCSGFICIQTGNERPGDAVILFDGASYRVQGNLAQHPAYAVTWYGADAYCRAIGRRLPTEAEWERAARGDDGRIYPWGNEWNPALAQTGRPAQGERVPVAVGSFQTALSPYNALDLAGNVAEWVQDWYNPAYYGQMASQPQPVVDPAGPPTGVEKVLRGGSWDALPFFARTVHRQSWVPAPDTVEADFPRWIGFRCAEDIDPNEVIAPAGGVDPATLGDEIPLEGEADTSQNAQPTLPPAPTLVQPPASAG